MIKLDVSSAIKKESIAKFEKIVAKIHDAMEREETKGFEFLGWKDLPKNIDHNLLKNIKKKVKFLKKEKIEVLVVIGIGGSYLGAKAGIDMIKGMIPFDRKYKVIFAGTSISSVDLVQKLKYVENKRFAINVISKSGKTLEPGLAFRYFRHLLEEQVGPAKAAKLIIATTDANKGGLLKIAKKYKYDRFIIPENIGGRYSVLTPVGLLPFAFLNCDIDLIVNGAYSANKKYSDRNLIKNDAYIYAVTRYLLSKKFNIELFVGYHPQLNSFAQWWAQLFGESEGKNEKGLFPATAIFTQDLHSLGQYIQEGKKQLFETIITVKDAILDLPIIKDNDNYDELNYLLHKNVNQINNIVSKGVSEAHVLAGKVPNIKIQIDKMNEFTLGELFYFFERACAMSAYLLNLNPFDQPGVEIYKLNISNLLGKTIKK